MSPKRTYSESDVRIRPNSKGSRPRTKDRPRYDEAIQARVITVDRGRYTTLVDQGTETERAVIAVRARELRRTPVVVGDRVDLVGDVSGATDALARLVRIRERATLLRRSADDGDSTERVLVANADQLVIVTAAADPEPRPRFIDRSLAAAFNAGMDALIVVTKTDLAGADALARLYDAIDVAVLATSLPPEDAEGDVAAVGVEEVRRRLQGKTSVLIGHSGVGKSTLINALVPEARRATGVVNAVTGRGRHTSSSAIGLRLPDDEHGWVVDTPGVRSFGLAHVTPETLLAAFTDLVPASADCPRGCLHHENSPRCQLDSWVQAGNAGARGQERLDSFRRLLSGVEQQPGA
ncbi:ribosome small subunit-dependent GTPase A [Saxibacter everestensis]|uniref:Small ribosomal subunit biogenesis GTPase RsgA n=1 Tax=Saxibacter everestensis TaxID=2909229 RepID=A0ABY8QNH2_9MICO|nr:ribosome small subunit-dependent GTPase A [Brevibacteriaceae bacterium ZFBP1038]